MEGTQTTTKTLTAEDILWADADDASSDEIEAIGRQLDAERTDLWLDYEIEREQLLAELEARYQAREAELEARAEAAQDDAYHRALADRGLA